MREKLEDMEMICYAVTFVSRAVKYAVKRLFFLFGAEREYAKLRGCFLNIKDVLIKLGMRLSYWRIVRRIRHFDSYRKIRVLFWVSNTSKWKTQSLYDELRKSKSFEPYVFVTTSIEESGFLGDNLRKKLVCDAEFYRNLGCDVLLGYNENSLTPLPVLKYKPDIVFYQEPISFFDCHKLEVVSSQALCCYCPYYVELGDGLIPIHDFPWFHRLLFAQFASNKESADVIKDGSPWYHRSGSVIPTGQTNFDDYLLPEQSGDFQYSDCVIYAPHFSFAIDGIKRPHTLATFIWNGRAILEYARKHPEINWVFKPHPRLRLALIREAKWSKDDVDAYYRDWEKIGKGCYEGAYIGMFVKSRAMITDCGSFLAEYAVSEHPLIRLIPEELDFKLQPVFEDMCSTFYNVRNLEEMYATFKLVLEDRLDPKRERRISAVRNAGLKPGGAAGRIVDYLKKVSGRSL